jgi:hypothetical protein
MVTRKTRLGYEVLVCKVCNYQLYGYNGDGSKTLRGRIVRVESASRADIQSE